VIPSEPIAARRGEPCVRPLRSSESPRHSAGLWRRVAFVARSRGRLRHIKHKPFLRPLRSAQHVARVLLVPGIGDKDCPYGILKSGKFP